MGASQGLAGKARRRGPSVGLCERREVCHTAHTHRESESERERESERNKQETVVVQAVCAKTIVTPNTSMMRSMCFLEMLLVRARTVTTPVPQGRKGVTQTHVQSRERERERERERREREQSRAERAQRAEQREHREQSRVDRDQREKTRDP